jgi:hypothetical protein
MSFKILILNLISSSCLAANWSADPAGTWIIKSGIKVPTLEMKIFGDPEKIEPELHFRPNSPTQYFLSLSTGPISLAGSFNTPPTELEKALYGESKVTDYQLRFYQKFIAFDLFYQRYQSYYIENSSEVDSKIKENDPLIQRSDLGAENWGGQIYLNLTPDEFSLPAVLDQSGVQKESAWGFFLLGGAAHSRILAEQALVPSSLTSAYKDFSFFEGGEFTIAKWGCGTGYVGIKGPWFFSSLLLLSFGQEDQNYTMSGEKIYRHKYHNSANFKLTLGYSGQNFITGLQSHADENTLPVENVNIQLITTDISVFLGAKF